MLISQENYRKIIKDLKAIRDPVELFVALFYLCKQNWISIVAERNNRYWVEIEKKVLKHFNICLERKEFFLTSIWGEQFLKTKFNFLVFIVNLLEFLDDHLFNVPEVDGLGEWVLEQGKGLFRKCTLPTSWSAPEQILISKPKNLIYDKIPKAKRWERDRTSTSSTIYEVVRRLVVVDSHIFEGFELDYRRETNYFIQSMIETFQDEGRLNFAVSSLRRDIEYDKPRIFDRDTNGRTPYLFTPFLNPEILEQQLEITLARAWNEHVDVLLFPELTIDISLQKIIKDWLAAKNEGQRIKLIIAGSYHFQASGGRWENRTEIYDGYGQLLWAQAKINPYRLEPGDLQKMKAEVREHLGIENQGGYEKIDPGKKIVIIDTNLGRMAFPICLDFIDDKHIQIYKETWTNLIFVPAMSPTGLNRFAAAAKTLGQSHAAITLVVNSCWCMGLSKEEVQLDDIYHFYAPHKELSSRMKPKIDCKKCGQGGVCLALFYICKLST